MEYLIYTLLSSIMIEYVCQLGIYAVESIDMALLLAILWIIFGLYFKVVASLCPLRSRFSILSWSPRQGPRELYALPEGPKYSAPDIS